MRRVMFMVDGIFQARYRPHQIRRDWGARGGNLFFCSTAQGLLLTLSCWLCLQRGSRFLWERGTGIAGLRIERFGLWRGTRMTERIDFTFSGTSELQFPNFQHLLLHRKQL